MVKFEDIVTLAKSGWTPKQVKEVLEMLETSPQVKDADAKDLEKKAEERKEEVDGGDKKEEKPDENKDVSEEDDIQILAKLLK